MTTRKQNHVFYSYKIEDTPLNRSSHIKDLGISFDQKLTFADHIGEIVTTSFKMYGFI